MHIDQIEVGETYYSYDCWDNSIFRLLRYFVISKATWTLTANVYAVERRDREIGIWSGYPDNLYRTVREALKAFSDKAQAFVDAHRNPLANAVTVEACCDTCTELRAGMCDAHGIKIETPTSTICKDGDYNCDPEAINRKVIEVQK